MRALLVLLLLHRATYGVAQSSSDPHEVQPVGRTVSAQAGTVAPGWLASEAGAEFARYSDASHGGSARILFKIGLARQLQLSIQTPLVHPAGTNTTATGDASIGMKWRFLQHE